MSSVRESYEWLQSHLEHLSPVDRAYLLAIKHKCEDGIPYDIALRLAVIYGQTILRLSKAPQNERALPTTTRQNKPAEFDRVTLANDEFRIYLAYGSPVKDAVKFISGVRWNPIDKWWYGPQTAQVAANLLTLIDSGRLLGSEVVITRCQELAGREQRQRELSKATASTFKLRPGFGAQGYQPRPFQLAGVEYAVGVPAPFFADDMGLGKSIQVLAWNWHIDGFPLLIVTKATLKFNIAEEVEKAYPWAKVVICDSQTTFAGKVDVFVINYDLLTQATDKKKGTTGWQTTAKKRVNLSPVALRIIDHGFNTIALDECHAIKAGTGKKSQRAQACLQMGEHVKNKALMSGSPIMNRNIEVINYLKFLGQLDKFGGEWNFKQRYCNARQVRIKGQMVWDFTGSSNSLEMQDLLTKYCMIRRLKSEVLHELPDKTRSHIKVEISNQAEYDKAKKHVLRYYSEIKSKQEEFLHSIRNLTGDAREEAIIAFRKRVEIRAAFAEALIAYNTLRQITSLGKLPALLDKLEDLMEDQQRKVIIFAFYKATQRAIYEAVKHYGAVTVFGDDSLEERKAAVKAFQHDPAVRVIVVSISAGSEGLNLTAAQDVLTIETCFVPAIQWQCEDRAYRIGQKNAVTCYYLWGKGTIDEKVKEILERKERICLESIDGVRGNASIEDMEEVLSTLL